MTKVSNTIDSIIVAFAMAVSGLTKAAVVLIASWTVLAAVSIILLAILSWVSGPTPYTAEWWAMLKN